MKRWRTIAYAIERGPDDVAEVAERVDVDAVDGQQVRQRERDLEEARRRRTAGSGGAGAPSSGAR
jgi:hypothetical protein